VFGATLSMTKLLVADHAETLPALSVSCARQKYVPSERVVGVQVPVAPTASPLADEPGCNTVLHALSLHSWNDIVPVSDGSGSANTAESCGCPS